MRTKLLGGKLPWDGKNSGGVDFVEGKRHEAERKPPMLMGGVLGEKTARGGKIRAELFRGMLSSARQNSAGLDFVERKRQGTEKKPLWLIGCKPPWSLKMEGVLVGKNGIGEDKM
ncbi:hypothetical protein T10_2890 [Trichinella papuae]|uniref:Uncharacterized protein n=1 Tax=Trichinella papuae TaxID=268474 RepID=A0A0V1M2N9_9BILA|nr:hypothetical protein T10_2890 [Trichinella papuae]